MANDGGLYQDDNKRSALIVRAGVYVGAGMLLRSALRTPYVRQLAGRLIEGAAEFAPTLSRAQNFASIAYRDYSEFLHGENLLQSTVLGQVPRLRAFLEPSSDSPFGFAVSKYVDDARRIFSESWKTARPSLGPEMVSKSLLGNQLRSAGGILSALERSAAGEMRVDEMPPELLSVMQSLLARTSSDAAGMMERLGMQVPGLTADSPVLQALDKMREVVTTSQAARSHGEFGRPFFESQWKSFFTSYGAKAELLVNDMMKQGFVPQMGAQQVRQTGELWADMMTQVGVQSKNLLGAGAGGADVANKLTGAIVESMRAENFRPQHWLGKGIQRLTGWGHATAADLGRMEGLSADTLKRYGIPEASDMFGPNYIPGHPSARLKLEKPSLYEEKLAQWEARREEFGKAAPGQFMKRWGDSVIDDLVFKSGNRLIDLRPMGLAVDNLMDSLEQNLRIPYLGVSPLRLLFHSTMRDIRGAGAYKTLHYGQDAGELRVLRGMPGFGEAISAEGVVQQPIVGVGTGAAKGGIRMMNLMTGAVLDPGSLPMRTGLFAVPQNMGPWAQMFDSLLHGNEMDAAMASARNKRWWDEIPLLGPMLRKLDFFQNQEFGMLQQGMSVFTKYKDPLHEVNIARRLAEASRQGHTAESVISQLVYETKERVSAAEIREIVERVAESGVHGMSHVPMSPEEIERSVKLVLDDPVSIKGVHGTRNRLEVAVEASKQARGAGKVPIFDEEAESVIRNMLWTRVDEATVSTKPTSDAELMKHLKQALGVKGSLTDEKALRIVGQALNEGQGRAEMISKLTVASGGALDSNAAELTIARVMDQYRDLSGQQLVDQAELIGANRRMRTNMYKYQELVGDLGRVPADVLPDMMTEAADFMSNAPYRIGTIFGDEYRGSEPIERMEMIIKAAKGGHGGYKMNLSAEYIAEMEAFVAKAKAPGADLGLLNEEARKRYVFDAMAKGGGYVKAGELPAAADEALRDIISKDEWATIGYDLEAGGAHTAPGISPDEAEIRELLREDLPSSKERAKAALDMRQSKFIVDDIERTQSELAQWRHKVGLEVEDIKGIKTTEMNFTSHPPAPITSSGLWGEVTASEARMNELQRLWKMSPRESAGRLAEARTKLRVAANKYAITGDMEDSVLARKARAEMLEYQLNLKYHELRRAEMASAKEAEELWGEHYLQSFERETGLKTYSEAERNTIQKAFATYDDPDEAARVVADLRQKLGKSGIGEDDRLIIESAAHSYFSQGALNPIKEAEAVSRDLYERAFVRSGLTEQEAKIKARIMIEKGLESPEMQSPMIRDAIAHQPEASFVQWFKEQSEAFIPQESLLNPEQTLKMLGRQDRTMEQLSHGEALEFYASRFREQYRREARNVVELKARLPEPERYDPIARAYQNMRTKSSSGALFGRVEPGGPSALPLASELERVTSLPVGEAARNALDQYYVGRALGDVKNWEQFMDQIGTVLGDVEIENMVRTFDLYNIKRAASRSSKFVSEGAVDASLQTLEAVTQGFGPRYRGNTAERLQAAAMDHFGKRWQRGRAPRSFATQFRQGRGNYLFLQKPVVEFSMFDIGGSVKRTWGNVKRLTEGMELGHGVRHVMSTIYKQFDPVKMVKGGLAVDFDYLSTGMFYPTYMAQRLNRGLGEYGLGMSMSPGKMGTMSQTMLNLAKYRVLPVVLGATALSYLDWESEKLSADEEGKGGTRISRRLANIYVGTRLDIASVMDRLGITSRMKRLYNAFPGMDVAADSPVGMLATSAGIGVPKTREELAQWYAEGDENIRSGRFWMLSNTPWAGGRITATVPNWYRRGTSGFREDTLWGGGDDYWSHSWMPTPRYPLAPLHKLLDPYWFEKKHYRDRPYPLTGAMFEETMPLGGVLNDTIGMLLKPQRRMHTEEMNSRKAQTGAGPRIEGMMASSGIDPMDMILAGYASGRGRGPDRSWLDLGTVSPMYTGIGPAGAPSGQQIAGLTGDGLVATGADMIAAANTTDRLAAKRQIRKRVSFFKRQIDPNQVIMPSDPYYRGGQLYYNMTELGGIYGFGMTQLTKYDIGDQKPVLQSADRAYSQERWFWDQGIGGLGGGVSEIGRRFLPHRRRQIQEYNPILNTMPSWLPGSASVEPDYYLNFHQGDPYTKVAMGEARLPGAGYEKLHPELKVYHGNYGLEEFRASSLGQTVPQTVAAMLGMVPDMEALEQGIATSSLLPQYDGPGSPTYEGTKIHQRLQAKWGRAGLLAGAEVYAKDPDAGISGHLDAYIRTPWGYDTVVEIKTKTEQGIAALQGPDPQHVSQLNYYLHATGLPEGFLYYTARGEPTDTKVFKVEFDPDRLQRDLSVVQAAREQIKGMEASGIINPWEHYSDVDKLKILSDTAPYSESYRVMRRKVMSDRQTIEEQGRWDEVQHTMETHQLRMKRYRTTEYKYAGQEDPEDATPFERAAGYLWEKFAHADTPFHTKFLHVRSAREEYERNYLTGNQFANWNHPVSAILAPAYRGYARHNPAVAAAWGGFTGSLFGAPGPYRALGAIVGATTAASMSVKQHTEAFLKHESVNVPDIRRKQWAIEQYFDILEYVKYKGLSQRFANMASQAGVNVGKMDPRKQYPFSPIINHFMEYQRRAKGTAYGADSANQSQAMSAWPAEIREFYPEFARVRDPKARKELYEETAPNLRRFLARAWATDSTRWKVEADRLDRGRPKLPDYFSKHALPPPRWVGWSPNVDLEEYKVKVMKSEGIDARQAGLWDDVVTAAERNSRKTIDWDHPNIGKLSMGHIIKNILGGKGISDADVRVDVTSHNQDAVDIRMSLDRDHTGQILQNLHRGGWQSYADQQKREKQQVEQSRPFAMI